MSHSARTGPRAKPTYATPEKYDVASPRRLAGARSCSAVAAATK